MYHVTRKILPLLLLAIFVVSGCVSKPSKTSDTSVPQNTVATSTSEKQKPPVTEAGYQAEIKAILVPVWASQNVTGVTEALLAVTVPPTYLELHLNLVIAITNIEQGQKSSDQAKVKKGSDSLAALAIQYSWLK